MYHTILFDLDGTLTDSKEGIFNCLRDAFRRLGKAVPPDDVLLRFIGPPLQDSFREVCGFDAQTTQRGIAYFRERYAIDGKFENAAAPGMPELCARLKAQGYTLALASSKPEAMCLLICEKYGFTPSLDVITGSPPVGDWQKEDVIRECLRRLGKTDLSDVVMVGDRKYDVLGAAACGIRCIGVDFFGYAPPGELLEAGALAVVHTAGELEEYLLTH